MTRPNNALSALLCAWIALATCGDDPAGAAADDSASGDADAAADVSDSPDTDADADADADDTTHADLPAGNVPPLLLAPAAQQVAEGDTLTVTVAVSDANLADVRVFAEGLPPGARWDEPARTLSFTPDFIQGGATWTVTLTATDGVETVDGDFEITALDTITPPAPTVTRTDEVGAARLLRVAQTTDAFLDSPGFAGRSFDARVVVPKAPAPAAGGPVRVARHGFGGSPGVAPSADEIVLRPHDPANSCRPGESVTWRFGTSSGAVEARDDDNVTIPQLPLTTDWTSLTLERALSP